MAGGVPLEFNPKNRECTPTVNLFLQNVDNYMTQINMNRQKNLEKETL